MRLDTPRLVLRPLTVDDFEPFYARLVCDPIVMTFYHAYAEPLTDAERRERAQRDFFDHFADGRSRFGYVCWAVTARAPIATAPGAPIAADELLGWAGIVTPALTDPTLGPERSGFVAQAAERFAVAHRAHLPYVRSPLLSRTRPFSPVSLESFTRRLQCNSTRRLCAWS